MAPKPFTILDIRHDTIHYRYDDDDPRSYRQRTIEQIKRWSTSLTCHDTSNPYLAPRGLVRCVRCFEVWERDTNPPLKCNPNSPNWPRGGVQAFLDGLHARQMAAEDKQREFNRHNGIKPRMNELPPLERQYTGALGGLGSAVFSSWNGRVPK